MKNDKYEKMDVWEGTYYIVDKMLKTYGNNVPSQAERLLRILSKLAALEMRDHFHPLLVELDKLLHQVLHENVDTVTLADCPHESGTLERLLWMKEHGLT